MVKRCAWGSYNSDSRYLERLKRENGGTVNFISFANAKMHKERRKAWIRTCCCGDNFVCTKDSYICSLHFIGKFGPTEENPDPITTSTSAEKVSLFGDLLKMRYFTTLHKVYNVYLFYIICAIISQVARLSRKRKPPSDRVNATKARKQIRKADENCAAETLVALSLSSKARCAEEICAAKTLVSLGDVSLEREVPLSSHSRECETVFEDGKWHLYVINALLLQAWLLWLFTGSIHFLQDSKY